MESSIIAVIFFKILNFKHETKIKKFVIEKNNEFFTFGIFVCNAKIFYAKSADIWNYMILGNQTLNHRSQKAIIHTIRNYYRIIRVRLVNCYVGGWGEVNLGQQLYISLATESEKIAL